LQLSLVHELLSLQFSGWQKSEQPSQPAKLPSSHVSVASTTLLPQVAHGWIDCGSIAADGSMVAPEEIDGVIVFGKMNELPPSEP
jgi:hypothetical protein